ALRVRASRAELVGGAPDGDQVARLEELDGVVVGDPLARERLAEDVGDSHGVASSRLAPERMPRMMSRQLFPAQVFGTSHTSIPAKIETAKTRTSGVPARGCSFPRTRLWPPRVKPRRSTSTPSGT